MFSDAESDFGCASLHCKDGLSSIRCLADIRHQRPEARYKGLPHLRSGPSGKLIFYRDQVVAWILTNQQKGGMKL
jgi:hypothetical protein